MRKPKLSDYLTFIGFVIIACLLFQSWHAIVSFIGILLTAIIPLLLGVAIAYVVSIPTNFLERHFFPDSKSPVVNNIRKPVCLAITVIALVAVLVLASVVLVPALTETVTMVQQNGEAFLENLIQYPAFKPVREVIHNFLQGDFMQDLKALDVDGLAKTMFGGTVGSITTQLFTVVSTIMTGFFGMLFSFILLTDNANTVDKLTEIVAEYIGPKRAERLGIVITVADSSFHNFIVRQCIEAVILGTVGTVVLLLGGFRYALGVGALMGLAALVPIVGYPVGLFGGAFMVAMLNGWLALAYIVFVAIAQVLEATFVLPHVGDPRTVLPPVWTTVGVTIGGGVAGFLGMLLAIPITATIRQLVIINARRRREAKERAKAMKEAEEAKSASHLGEAKLPESLVDNNGAGVGEVE